MYYGTSTFIKITHLFSSLILPRIGFLALKWRRHQGVRSPCNPSSDRRKSLPDDFDIAPHSLIYTRLASPWLAERFINHFQVAQYPISSILGENSFYLEATLPHVGDQNAYSTNVMYHSELSLLSFFHRAQTAPKSLLR